MSEQVLQGADTACGSACAAEIGEAATVPLGLICTQLAEVTMAG
jgi:hypothetical protein